jgi:TonB family protein
MFRSIAAMIPAIAIAVAAPLAGAAETPARLLYAEGGLLVLVPPAYPPAALAGGKTATVEITGTVRTDGRLDHIGISSNPPDEAFESAVMDVAPLWRLQPRILTPGCGATETRGHVTIWFEIDRGKPKVSYGAHRPVRVPAPEIHLDRQPQRLIAPRYPRELMERAKTPKTVLQVAYVAVSADGAVTGVTVAPMLYYRDFEPFLAEALRQWKYPRQESAWCGEVQFNLSQE